MAKKIISIRGEEKLLEEFDKLEGSRSSNVVKAMEDLQCREGYGGTSKR